jgi:hypothetical protein
VSNQLCCVLDLLDSIIILHQHYVLISSKPVLRIQIRWIRNKLASWIRIRTHNSELRIRILTDPAGSVINNSLVSGAMIPAEPDPKKIFTGSTTLHKTQKNIAADIILIMLKYVPLEATSDHRIPILSRMKFS